MSLDANPLNIDEAAEFLSLKKSTLYSKVCRRELPFYKQAGRLYFFRSELLNWIKSGSGGSLDVRVDQILSSND